MRRGIRGNEKGTEVEQKWEQKYMLHEETK
jgi:hypothetical protein